MPIALGSAYGEIEINTSGAENSISGLAGMLKETGTTLSLGISAPLLGVAATALKSAGDFEQAMNQMKLASGATDAQMKQLQDVALKLGADTSFSAGEAAEGMLELSKAGLSADQTMKAIPGTLDLAAAGGLSVARAAEISANALNAFHLPADKATEVANTLAAAANASSLEVQDLAEGVAIAGSAFSSNGQDLKTLSAELAILGNNGIKGSLGANALKMSMQRLATPTADAKQMLQQLGVQVYDAQGKMRPFPAILADLQKGLHGTMTVTQQNAGATSANSKQAQHYLNIINQTKQKLADYQSGVAGVAQSEAAKKVAVDRLNRTLLSAQAEYTRLGGVQASTTTKTVKMTDELRNQALEMIFGKEAVGSATVLINNAGESYDHMAEAVGNATAATDMADARMKGFNGAIEYVKGSIDSFLIETALPFLDSFSGIIRSVGDAVTAIGKIPEPVKNAALAFLAVLAAAGPVLLALSWIGTLLGALLSPVGLIVIGVGLLAAAWAADFGGIQEKTAAVWAAIQPVLTQLWTMLQGQLVTALVTLGAWWAGVWPQIQAATLAAWTALQPILTQLWTWLQTSLPVALTLLQTWFNTAWTTISTAINTAMATAGPLLTQLWTWLGVSLPLALNTLQSWFTTAWATITGSVTTASSTMTGIFTTIQTAWNALVALFAPSLARLGESILAFGAQIGGMGGQFQGLLTAAQNLWAALQPILTQLGVLIGLIGVTIGVVAVMAINLLAATFQNLAPIVGAVVNQATAILNTLTTVITETVALVTALINGDWAAAWEHAQTIVSTLGAFVQTSLANLWAVISIVFAVIGSTIKNTLADLGFQAAADAVQGVIDKITSLVDWLGKIATGDIELGFAEPEWIKSLLAWAGPAFTEPDWMKKFIAWVMPEKAPTWMQSFLAWAWPNTPKAITDLTAWKFPEVPQIVKDFVAWAWPDAPQVLKDLVDFDWPDVPKAIDNLLNFAWPDIKTPDWIKTFTDAIDKLLGWVPQLPSWMGGSGNAGGSSYFMGGMTALNERGRELVAIPADQAILPAGSQIYTNGQANRMMAGAGGEWGGNLVNIEKVYVTNQQDVHSLAWQIDNLRRRSAGR